MQGIEKFFDKFRNKALEEMRRRESICEAVYKVVGQRIEIKDINLKGKIATLKVDQGFKSEIFLKKKRIIDLIPNILIDIK